MFLNTKMVQVVEILPLWPWWRHQMETFSALLALCEGNPPVTGGFPSQRPVTQSFDVFFGLRLNKRLSKQSRRRWFERPSRLLWHHCNDDSVRPYNFVLMAPEKLHSCWSALKLSGAIRTNSHIGKHPDRNGNGDYDVTIGDATVTHLVDVQNSRDTFVMDAISSPFRSPKWVVSKEGTFQGRSLPLMCFISLTSHWSWVCFLPVVQLTTIHNKVVVRVGGGSGWGWGGGGRYCILYKYIKNAIIFFLVYISRKNTVYMKCAF